MVFLLSSHLNQWECSIRIRVLVYLVPSAFQFMLVSILVCMRVSCWLVINATQVTYSLNLSLFLSHSFPTVNVVEDPALCAVVLTLISGIIIVASLPFSLFFCIKVSCRTNVLSCSYCNDTGMV